MPGIVDEERQRDQQQPPPPEGVATQQTSGRTKKEEENMKLVIYPAVEADFEKRIVDKARGMQVVNASTEEQAQREIVDAQAFYGKIAAPLLSAARNLRWVQCPTASLEHYLFPELVTHPCQLTNMRGLYSDLIADHVFGYILCFARHFHRYIRNQSRHRWEAVGGESERAGFRAGVVAQSAIDRAHIHLADQTLGIVGLGGIGSEVARRGLAFGMRVVAVDPAQTEAPPGTEKVWKPEQLSNLLSESDFVAICAPHTPQTYKLFRRRQFQQMKSGAYLINVGRGVIVDLIDLTAALQAGEIAGAGLDVFEVEPLPSDHSLWEMENVIITPHVAGYSLRVAERHQAVLLENIGLFLGGEPLRNAVDKERWY